MSSSKKALVLTGDGINCEQETAQALNLAGFRAEIRHLNDVIAEKTSLATFSLLALPGGFSFGDDLTSGKVLALKIKHGLGWELNDYARQGGLVVGICNGFQALIRLGVFGRDVSITHNSHGKFQDTWTTVAPTAGNRCVWLKGVGAIDVPIRHGEGRITLAPEKRAETLKGLEERGMAALRYQDDPNGSESRLAGLCDESGRIFGLMPHPEAFVRATAHPDWTLHPDRADQPGQGLKLFQNAYEVSR